MYKLASYINNILYGEFVTFKIKITTKFINKIYNLFRLTIKITRMVINNKQNIIIFLKKELIYFKQFFFLVLKFEC